MSWKVYDKDADFLIHVETGAMYLIRRAGPYVKGSPEPDTIVEGLVNSHPYRVGDRVVLNGLPGTVVKAEWDDSWGTGIVPCLSIDIDAQTNVGELYRVPCDSHVVPE